VVLDPVEGKVIRIVAGEGEPKGCVDDVRRIATMDDDQAGVGMMFRMAVKMPAPKGQQKAQFGIEVGIAQGTRHLGKLV